MAKILFNIYCKLFEYSLKTLHNTVKKKNAHSCATLVVP